MVAYASDPSVWPAEAEGQAELVSYIQLQAIRPGLKHTNTKRQTKTSATQKVPTMKFSFPLQNNVLWQTTYYIIGSIKLVKVYN